MVNGHVGDAFAGDAANRAAVAHAEGGIGDVDVRAGHDQVVVATRDIVVAKEDATCADVHAVGILGRLLARHGEGRDGDAGDGHVGVPLDPDVLFGRVLHADAADEHARRVREADLLRASQGGVGRERRPPGLALPFDGASSGQRDVMCVVGGDESGRPQIACHGEHLQHRAGRQFQARAARKDDGAAEKCSSWNHDAAASSGRGGGKSRLDCRGVVGLAITDRAVAGHVEHAGTNRGQRNHGGIARAAGIG